ncbi:phosphoribosylanthranilate isomerase [Deinococcus metalli]|uniref:N-(5'-phosphoribosyl)anthranilate isomerase n=1 Tax=Deinococcus metalli TaxID=1141878 RepID=A0A7W8NTN2_9DEIO|nr:phosphoribosylanthranilate isomerase [Deinococcus metalli]MBB5378367.1 phosphoribosylanthranilate isomerase [Deinococcus metalli]GHF59417.1 N-(5'-phosphoribosyl)anthranilate isomerase [Deinococcus metalli]
MIRVKVCGTTSVHDAVLSAEAGADALGFIFAPVSKRLVSARVARDAGLGVGPAVARVGVFLNQGLDEVLRTAEAARVSAVQLHGPLSRLYVEEVAAYYPVLRVVRPADLAGHSGVWTGGSGVTPMLDAPEPGGGVPLDWAALRPHFPPGAWLAGGLGPANVAEAIRALRPGAVDAVSRLESAPGVKDAAAVRAFVQAVRGADCGSYPQ